MVTPPASSSMASGDDGPLRQGAREGLDWFLVATEASGGGTSDLSSVLGFSRFIGGVGIGFTSRGPTGSPRGRGWALGGCPPPSWWPRDSPSVDFCSSIFYIFQKYSPLIFSAFRELLFLHKNNTTVILLKTASVRVSSNQIIPKSCKNIVNMEWMHQKL